MQGELESRSELVPAFLALRPLGSLVLCSQGSRGLGSVGQVHRKDSCTGALGGGVHPEAQKYDPQHDDESDTAICLTTGQLPAQLRGAPHFEDEDMLFQQILRTSLVPHSQEAWSLHS